ncbi:prephenate dehydratase [Corynebacterium breve]|uniref:Prephenate dehydratase n=1 Tax=Corynebacterium breve TaxID=3049799 RepID=A0ABY8VCY2_9CORY|nr:prephenate dehydratase [Corynebacterium breve]WIM67526.1 prephenate dehydratase [Corynebacterium breve]
MTTVAYLGPAGTFTEEALWKFRDQGAFGQGEVTALPAESPSEALNLIRTGEAQFAVVAIENSVDGAVTSTTDALIEAPGVQIYDELELSISFAIMTRPGAQLTDVRRFSTHPVAQRQVRDWVANNIPQVSFTAASSNAAAAKAVADGEADVAAAPLRAADLFGLEVHAQGIADMATAQTRFIVVGPTGKPTPRTGKDRSFVVFDLPNEPGTLVGALQEFAFRGVNMSRIESRPTRKTARTYNFYVDLVGHIDDAPLAEALRNLWLRANSVTFLGSWPAAAGEEREKALAHDIARLEAATNWVKDAQEGR